MLYGTNTLSISGESGVQGVKKRSDKRWKGRCEGTGERELKELLTYVPSLMNKGNHHIQHHISHILNATIVILLNY